MIVNKEKVLLALVIILASVAVINQFFIFSLGSKTLNISGQAAKTGESQTDLPDVAPKGVPSVYGKELSVSYDDISSANSKKADDTIRKLGILDTQITLKGEDLKRYIRIVSEISCEYCCGAESIIFSNGDAACGCAHSYAMRGLAKYLIKNHPNEFTDDDILEELGKWKTLFFPQQIAAKAKVLSTKGVELNYINLASNVYRGVEQEVSGGMVGGC